MPSFHRTIESKFATHYRFFAVLFDFSTALKDKCTHHGESAK